MKHCYIIIAILFKSILLAQTTWPAPNVAFSIKPRWEITFRDSLSPNEGYHSKYGYETGKMSIIDDYLYTQDIDLTFDYYGGCIQKINIKSGEVVWNSIHNKYTVDRQESLQNYYLNNNGDIEVLGLRVVKPFNPSFPIWITYGGLNCNIYKRIISNTSGQQLDFFHGIDTTSSNVKINPPVGIGTIYKINNANNQYIFIKKYSPIGLGRLFFYKVNDQLDLEADPYDSLSINSTIDADRIHNNWTEINQIDSNLFVATLSHIAKDENLYPAKVELVYFNIDVNYKISVLNRVDITNYFKFPRYYEYTKTRIINGFIFINDQYNINNKANGWLAMLDKIGNKLLYIENPIIDNHKYYNFHDLIIESDTSLLAIASPSKSLINSSIDLIRISKSSQCTELGALNWDPEFAVRGIEYSSKDSMLLIAGILCKNNCKDRWSKYLAFNISDLGYKVATNEHITITRFQLCPNPATNYLEIKSEFPFDEINIVTLERTILQHSISRNNFIDISNIPIGLYFCELKYKGIPIGKQKFIKGID